MDPTVVEVFAGLFFDVRPHMQAKDWIFSRAIGPGLWQGFNKDDLQSLWKYFGISLGPIGVDLAIAVSLDRELPAAAQNALGPAEQLLLRPGVRLAIAAMTRGGEREVETLLRLQS